MNNQVSTIKAGDFICKSKTMVKEEDEVETELIYFLVLDVIKPTIDVIPFKGTPLPNLAVFNWSEVEINYQIVVVGEYTKDVIYRKFTGKNSNLACEEEVATKYLWNDKSVTLPRNKIYYSGNGIWREYE